MNTPDIEVGIEAKIIIPLRIPGGSYTRVECLVTIRLRYRTSRPAEIGVVLPSHGDGRENEWITARSLFITGMTSHAGEGDVRVTPGPGRSLTLTFHGYDYDDPDVSDTTPPSLSCTVVVSAREVSRFIQNTLRRVPTHHEDEIIASVIDSGLDELLTG